VIDLRSLTHGSLSEPCSRSTRKMRCGRRLGLVSVQESGATAGLSGSADRLRRVRAYPPEIPDERSPWERSPNNLRTMAFQGYRIWVIAQIDDPGRPSYKSGTGIGTVPGLLPDCRLKYRDANEIRASGDVRLRLVHFIWWLPNC
jgi:hypothetical protein